MLANVEELEQALGHRFICRALLVRALTHSSSANEAQAGGIPPDVAVAQDNERLEFLGDSVLGWLVSEWLFERYRDFNEGQLSLLKNYLVSAAHLLAAAHRLELGRYLQLSRGEERAGGRSKQRLLVNAFEAVLAAVYLDGGAEAARGVLLRHSMPDEDELAQLAGSGPPHDFRAELERISRDRNLPRPQYLLLGEAGPGHARMFTVEVRLGRDIAVSGEGSSKKAAAHHAAQEVCRRLRGERAGE
jgi:ribonuclease-3